MSRVSVIGAGAWGTTLSILLAEKGHAVTLWAYEKDLVSEMLRSRENKRYMPGFHLPAFLTVTNNVNDLTDCEMYVSVIPTKFLRSTAKKIAPVIQPSAIVISASKGIEEKTLQLPLQILERELNNKNLCALSGPNLAAEVARGLPSASVVASKKEQIAKTAQDLLMLERFRIYTNDDVVGVQLGGALKNVIAIAAGIADGLGLGENAKASLMIRGIAEIARLGVTLGGRFETFAGLSGMGDLIATCSSRTSRNHFVGEQVAKGRKMSEILAGMKAVAEGVVTAQSAVELGKKLKIVLPITQEVYEVLYLGKDPYRAIADLLARSGTSE